jgi:hypothetical protein
MMPIRIQASYVKPALPMPALPPGFLAAGFAQDVRKLGQISMISNKACDPTADVWSFK